ncbi:MAG: hypothetical protein ACI4NO_07765 [Oxalobacter sp.]
MLKRLFALFFAIHFFLIPGMISPAFADDLSQGLELYHAKKYKEAIPYLERAANDGHEKAIEALDQIYGSQEKGQTNKVTTVSDKTNPDGEATKDRKNQIQQENANADEGKDATAPDTEKENSKSNFWRKVIAIFFAIGIAFIWFIHHTILRRKREQSKNKNPFQ